MEENTRPRAESRMEGERPPQAAQDALGGGSGGLPQNPAVN